MLCTVFSSILISRLAMSLKSEPAENTQPLLPSTIKFFSNSPYTPASTFALCTPAGQASIPVKPPMSKSRMSQNSDATAVEIELVESPVPDSATPFTGEQVVRYGYF